MLSASIELPAVSWLMRGFTSSSISLSSEAICFLYFTELLLSYRWPQPFASLRSPATRTSRRLWWYRIAEASLVWRTLLLLKLSALLFCRSAIARGKTNTLSGILALSGSTQESALSGRGPPRKSAWSSLVTGAALWRYWIFAMICRGFWAHLRLQTQWLPVFCGFPPRRPSYIRESLYLWELGAIFWRRRYSLRAFDATSSWLGSRSPLDRPCRATKN